MSGSMLRNFFRCFASAFSRPGERTRDPTAVEITAILDTLERELAALRSEYYSASADKPVYAYRAD